MNILVKNTLRNTFGKPLRTILVIFSIFVCSLSAMLSFDLSDSMKTVLLDDLRSVSTADFQVLVRPGQGTDMPDGFPEADTFSVYVYGEKIYTDIPGEYNYVKQQNLRVMGIDFEKAAEMEFTDYTEVGLMETVITYRFAVKHDLSEGSRITLHDKAGGPHEFTVVKVLPGDNRNALLSQDSALVNLESAEILSCGNDTVGLLMIDIKDNSLAEEAEEMLKEKYGPDSVDNLLVPEEILAMIDNLASILTMVFVITFLLVIFVTYSICERIVSERMSLVGTLRSLGMSSKGTAKLLLLENVFYAVFGSVPAVILYTLIRVPVMSLLLSVEYEDGSSSVPDIPPVSAVLLVSVILGAVLIECLIPLRAVLKALKTSVRDIIFDNRDTEYKFSKGMIITGIILIAAAAVLFFFRRNLVVSTFCMICAVTGLAFLFPVLFRYFTGLVKKISASKGDAKWNLALTEAVSRKSTVTSGILCATSATMCVIIFAIAMSAINTFSASVNKADVILSCTEKASRYSFVEHIDGVDEVENLYSMMDEVRIGDNGKIRYCTFYGVPEGGYKYYDMFRDLPDTIEDGTVYIHTSMTDVLGLKPGDKVTIEFNTRGLFPIRKEMTVGGTFNTVSANDGKNCFVISQADYIRIYHDNPSQMLIKTAVPEKVAAIINKYTTGDQAAKTRTEIEEEDRRDSASSIAVFTAVIALAIGMTSIGMVSNQIIGFEGRKKELAVMLSTAMSRKTLSSVLTREILTMSCFASGLGVIVGGIVGMILRSAIAGMDGVYFDLQINPMALLIFWVVMTFLYTLTVLFPVSRMKKMKISEQIKYE
ncbi:ABC transporter permease [Butyrivibrio sp. AE2032]|uniref:ABC transporter permease n=1 Tax=Butyrivibrio sp. AE2032 TaxID=1458463 RepID=UPI000550BDD1|nr:FtsX-like permease family protein [Butyrivibrio sp. AE2032]